jgi:pyruvate dehydrogenase E2 component (dihydrolipoamide acetyltransferase)
MAHILIMPRQGNTVESCVISEWLVKEGDRVEAATPVCIVETDKATFEIPSGAAGTVLKVFHAAGDDVPVLQPIMVVGEAGETWSLDGGPGGTGGTVETSAKSPGPAVTAEPAAAAEGAAGSAAAGHTARAAGGAGAAAEQAAPAAGQGPALRTDTAKAASPAAGISPRARKLAAAEAVDPGMLAGTGPGGRIIERDVAAVLAARPPLTAAAKAELARQIAGAGSGLGIGGRITVAGVLAMAGGPAEAPVAGTAAGEREPARPEYTDTPVKGIRKIIADQMMRSSTTTAAFTLNAITPALNLQTLRGRFKASAPELGLRNVTVNDLVLFAVSRILPRHPCMNAHKLDGTIRTYRDVHLGVAVSTPRGLMVPVLRNAGRLGLKEISVGAKKLAAACRDGAVSPDDLHGSTLTVTNLGNRGIESFTPVINIPEVAILGVCGIRPAPAETAPGHYEIMPHLGFSLTIDHAVVDGAPAAEFLKSLCDAVRDIDLLLLADSGSGDPGAAERGVKQCTT